jgi:pyruvate dehydrogenase E2 component (dihydrolipoamide acetyltransferase)
VEPAPAPVAEPPAPEPAAQPEPASEPETVLSFAPPPREPEPPKPAYRVTVKLAGDEPFVIAECAELEEAKEHAQGLIKQLVDASGDEWPYVSGRFLKPDTIVSVDVERL